MCNKEGYDNVAKEATAIFPSNPIDFYFPYNFNRISNVISANAVFPFTRLLMTNPGSGYMEPTPFFYNTDHFRKDSFYTGNFIPLFSDYELHFMEGDFIGYKKYQGLNTISDMITENPYLRQIHFGERVSLDKKSNISCEECIEKNIYRNGDKCMTCTPPDDVSSKDSKSTEEDDDNRVTMIQTIAEQMNPIIGDIEDLIEEIETSGFRHVVQQEFDLLTEANETLNSIIQ
jgi:hypothetical protein